MSEGVWIWGKTVPKERDMFSEFSLRGRWWLPSNPNDQVPGILHFSNDGIRLRLDRSFSVQELIQAYSIGSYKTDAVLGYTTDGSPCTVLTVFISPDPVKRLCWEQMLFWWALTVTVRRI